MIGKVETGVVNQGDRVKLMPTGMLTTVLNLYSNEQAVRQARPGDNVAIRCDLKLEDICKGFVLCQPVNEARAVTKFKAQLALVDLLDSRPLFTSGYTCMLHVHCCECEVTVGKLVSITDSKTKAEVPRPRFAKQNDTITCILEVTQSICLAPYSEYPQLGRLTLRDEGKSIAIGMVTELPKVKA